MTRTGDKAVGAIYRSRSSAGNLLLLPDVDPSGFAKAKGSKETKAAASTQFAARMISTIVALDKALRASGEITPEPAWASEQQFALPGESALRVQLLEAERAVEQAQKRKEELADSLVTAGASRALLFERGKPLEAAVIEAQQEIRSSPWPVALPYLQQLAVSHFRRHRHPMNEVKECRSARRNELLDFVVGGAGAKLT